MNSIKTIFLERLDTKKWAQNFISEESQRIENIIRESCQRSYKSKEPLLSKRYDSSATIRISNTLAKDHFNENLL